MPTHLSKSLTLAVLAAVVTSTLVPIEFRPPDLFPVSIGRALAFALLTASLVFTFPNKRLFAFAFALTFPSALEFLQILTHTRHPSVEDAVVKTVGAFIGVGAPLCVASLVRQDRPADRHNITKATNNESSTIRTLALPVDSRLITSAFFSQEDGRLRLRFRNGEEKVFIGVEETDAKALVVAESPGRHYIDVFRPKYKRTSPA